MEIVSKHSSKMLGCLSLTASAFFFALMSMFINLAGPAPFFEKALFRNVIALVLAGFVIRIKHIDLSVPRSQRLNLMGRCLFGTLSVYCNYYAISNLPLANSNSLSKLSPFFTILFAWIFLGEEIVIGQIICISIAFSGCCFLIFPNMDSWGFASCIGIVGGILSGGVHMFLRSMRKDARVNGWVIVCIFSLFSTIITIVPNAIFWKPLNFVQFGTLLIAGVCSAIGQILLTTAYSFAPPGDISVYDCTQIVFSAALGYLAFSEIPNTYQIMGFSLIMMGGVLLYFYLRHRSKAEK